MSYDVIFWTFLVGTTGAESIRVSVSEGATIVLMVLVDVDRIRRKNLTGAGKLLFSVILGCSTTRETRGDLDLQLKNISTSRAISRSGLAQPGPTSSIEFSS